MVATVPPPEQAWHEPIGRLVFKYAGAMVMDTDASGNKAVSLGKVLTVMLFVQAMILLRHGGDISPTHMTLLQTLLGYVFGKQGLTVLQAFADARKNRGGSDANSSA